MGGALRVGVFGAGAIGGYLGVTLSNAGAEVALVARQDVLQSRNQLCAVPIRRSERHPHDTLRVVTSAADLGELDVCLVTVKSRDSDAAGATLAAALAPDTTVVSFQNGLDNAERLARHLGAKRVAGGVCVYNVIRDGARLRQATTGALFAARLDGAAGAALERLRACFHAAGEKLVLVTDIEAVMAGKLLMNLNNGVCAATGLGIAASLSDADARWLFARCIHEGLAVFRRAGIEPSRRVTKQLPPSVVAAALGLPNALVLPIARALAGVDPHARSSTLQDLDRGKVTEIDDLNGAIARRGRELGVPAPANQAIVDAIHRLEEAARAGEPLAFVPAAELRRRASVG
jgi:2-dehydropantoate 2-reductase